MLHHVRRRPRAGVAVLCAVAMTGSALLGSCAQSKGADDGDRTGAETDVDRGEAGPGDTGDPTDSGEAGGPGAPEDPGGLGTAPTSYAVDPPGRRKPQLTADVLITGAKTLPEEMVAKIRAISGVAAVLPISLASSPTDGRTLTVAAVDPGGFRRYTPYPSWKADFVWERLAGGEVVVDDSVSRKLVGKDDMMALTNQEDAPTVHVGAYAPLVERIQAIVNTRRGEQLGMPKNNALLVSTGKFTPSALAERFQKALGDTATMQVLALELDVGAAQTAVLTGASVSAAVGTFSYTNRPNGEISPDPAWVERYIRREEVPILGMVTCNKAMLPQLRGALEEIVQSGLASKIHPDEYAGCYYPRYIGRDPAKGLSLHSWGIAVDLNVPGNLRGTVGKIDRDVVRVFKRWGFAWGGDWSYTDPMHFEMNAVVEAG